MKYNARKYCLNISKIISHGISACTTTYQCSPLDEFSVNIDNVTCNYPNITIDDLKLLSIPAYEKRVNDYLIHLNIEDSTLRNELITGSTYYDPNCDNVCTLNSDFLVYRFLSGVRVVNIGKPMGNAEYKAYPLGDDPNNYNWQQSATFLNLNLSETYVFEIRDILNSEEICKVQKTILLSTLAQSTTFTPKDKLIFIDEITNDSSGDIHYSTGNIVVDPQLINNEIVLVDYSLYADASGAATSSAELFCKPAGSNTYLSYCSITNVETNGSGTFTLSEGDDMCYNLTTIVPNAGSCGCACFTIDSVNGGGTTIPSIDQSRCCVTTDASIPRTNLTVSVSSGVTTNPNFRTINKVGVFEFTPSIPNDNYVTLQLNGEATISPSQIGASASITIKCKPNDGVTYDTIVNFNQNSPQPLSESIIVRYGDSLCYELNATSVAGTTSLACFNIIDTFDSYGISSTISSLSGASVTKTIPAAPVVVGLCVQNQQGGGSSQSQDGFINIEPHLTGNQCVRIDYCGDLFVSDVLNQLIGEYAQVTIYCKKSGNNSYVTLFNQTINQSSLHYNEHVWVCAGDSLCYCLDAGVNQPATSSASLCLNTALGANGVSASICQTPQKSYQYVEASS